MRITNLLDKNAILLNADISDKNTAINTLIEMHDKAGNLSDKEKYKEGIFAREKESTTAVGEGIAIPHAKSSAVKRPGLAAMTVPNGIEYGAPDGKPSNLFFMIAAPEDGDLHLEVLSRLMTLLMDLDLRKKLLSAQTADEFLQMMASGVRIRDEEKGLDEVTRPCRTEKIGKYTFSIVLTQGLNRQIRRMCLVCGYRVERLVRTRVMNIYLGSMKPGDVRELKEQELKELYGQIKDSQDAGTGRTIK